MWEVIRLDIMVFDKIVEEINFDLESGDMLIAHTDGLDEALNHEKENYGFKRLMSLIESKNKSNPSDMVGEILKDVKLFSEGFPQYDDLTLFAIQKK